MMRRKLIESLTYPRMLMVARMDLQDCPMNRFYDATQQACKTCNQDRECRWLNSNDEFSILTEQPMEVLFEAFIFSIDYIDAHVTREHHNYRHCACETCTWLKNAQHLARQFKGRSARIREHDSIR